MTIAELLLPEFDLEMAKTRQTIERIPNDKLDWQAHPRSHTIGWVMSHLVEMAGWVEGTLRQLSWDIAPAGEEPYQTPKLSSREEALKLFDDNVAAARAALSATTDADFGVDWSLLRGGQPLLTMSRYMIIRSLILNHTVHHRAYLCSYLRLNNIPVPGLYGPSGDE